MKQKAIIYARQSSGSDDYSESVAVQIANCKKLAAQLNIQIVDIISDLNISGKTYPQGWETLAASDRAFQIWAAGNSSGRLFRSGFGKVFTLLNSVDCIIVDDMTRLYRPLSRSYLENAVNQSLIEHNVKIIQVKGGTLDMSLFDQQLITMLKNQINDEQIAKQRQRSIEVFNNVRNSGIMPTGITAFALDYDRSTKRYTVNEEKAMVVRFIFQQISERNSYSSIIRTVNDRWKHLFNGCFWNKTLYEIARKPIYAGYQFDSQGELIPNIQGKAIISLKEYLTVQEIMNKKRREYLKNNCNQAGSSLHWLPLSGLLYCGNCGSKLVVAIEKNKINYRCRRGALLGNEACRSSRIAVNCTAPHITGLLEAIQVFFIEVIKQENDPVNRKNLLEAYLKNSFSNDEYETLLKASVYKVEVYSDVILIITSNRKYVLARRKIGRQRGFSCNYLTRLRKKFASDVIFT